MKKRFAIPVEIFFGNALVIKHKHKSASPSVRCVVTARFDGFTVTGEGDMSYKLPIDKMINVKVEYLDSKGNPASIDGDVEWETSNDMIANVGVLQGDSTQAQIVPGSQIGQAQITATADADLGEGTKHVICTLDVEVVGGEAVIGTITPVGEPQPIPDDNTDPNSPNLPDPHGGVPPNALGRTVRK